MRKQELKIAGVLAVTTIACGLLCGATEKKCVEIPSREIGTTVASSKFVIVGVLGKPLGTFVTIHGMQPREITKTSGAFQADMVDGVKLEQPQTLEVDWLRRDAKTPANGHYELRGYETGGMVSSPVEPDYKGVPPQQPYHFATWFVVAEVKQQPAAAR